MKMLSWSSTTPQGYLDSADDSYHRFVGDFGDVSDDGDDGDDGDDDTDGDYGWRVSCLT